MNKEDKSFLLFAVGILVIFFGYMFQDTAALMIGIGIFAFNQWFVFYKKKRKKQFYLLNYEMKWSTLKMLWGMMRDKAVYCWHYEALPNSINKSKEKKDD